MSGELIEVFFTGGWKAINGQSCHRYRFICPLKVSHCVFYLDSRDSCFLYFLWRLLLASVTPVVADSKQNDSCKIFFIFYNSRIFYHWLHMKYYRQERLSF